MPHFKTLLVVALKPEWAFLRAQAKWQRVHDHLLLYQNLAHSELALLQTGMGCIRSAKSVTDFLGEHNCSEMIHFGTCGALIHELKTGDVICADHITDGVEILDVKNCKNPALNNFSSGTLYTSPTILKNQQDKISAVQKTAASIVDMESFPVAKICLEKNIGYSSLRAVFDLLDDNLEAMDNPCTEAGDLSVLKLAGNIVKNPRLIRQLPKLKEKNDSAAKSLKNALAQIFNGTDCTQYKLS